MDNDIPTLRIPQLDNHSAERASPGADNVRQNRDTGQYDIREEINVEAIGNTYVEPGPIHHLYPVSNEINPSAMPEIVTSINEIGAKIQRMREDRAA